ATASFDDVLITAALQKRPSRSPDHVAESRALAALSQVMASNPDAVLQTCAELVLTLCHVESAGISVLEPGGADGVFRWRAAAGAAAAGLNSTIPRVGSPCNLVTERGRPLLFSRPERAFPALEDFDPPICEALLVPWHAAGDVVGTLWAVTHTPTGHFDAEDVRLLTNLATFASAGHQMALALARAKQGEMLEQEVARRTQEIVTAHERLRLSEERFRRAMDIGTVGVLFFNLKGRITDANAAFQRMSGFRRDELLGHAHWEALTPPAFIERTMRAAHELAERGETAPYEKELFRKDGSRWWGLFAPTRLGGRGLESVCVEFIIDVTEQKRVEAALRESEARFRHMADSAPALIWMTDADGGMTFANMHFDYVFGRAAAEMLGDGWKSVILPEDLDTYEAAVMAGVRARQPFKAEIRMRDRAGRLRWFRSECVPRLDDTGTYLGHTGCAVDITDARLAAEDLERRVGERTAELIAAEETLRQAQKMEAVGQLTGGIAHDFNNMLQGIAGGLDIARRRIAENRAADALRFLDRAYEAVGRAAGLTRRLLAFARRQRLDPKPVNVDALVADMAELIRRTTGPGVQLELRLQDGQGKVLCDPNELESALLNLCINARDAMPQGGRLTISTKDVRLSAADLIGEQEATPGGYSVISVADTGEGIPPEVLARVFEPFFTTKPVGQGTGLGLSQVYGFVQQSGGFVRLESTPGQGTTVHLTLPKHAHDAIAAQEEPAIFAASELAGAGATVLLVDDESSVREPAAERLRELGYRVLEAADGPGALRLLGRNAHLDLLVTDVGLPHGMNGRQVAEVVRERVPGVPVLFITGYAAAKLPPGVEVIGKPFALDALAQRVRGLLSARHDSEHAGSEHAGTERAGSQPTGSQPAGSKLAGSRPAGSQRAGNQHPGG
ncbi:MAG TPA: PAS domain S-box protein, partial [Rhodopila sp.]|nr:PAS domain S-box protein [Rhodopila sp.]